MTTADAYRELLRIQALQIRILRTDIALESAGQPRPKALEQAVWHGKAALKALGLRIDVDRAKQTHENMLREDLRRRRGW